MNYKNLKITLCILMFSFLACKKKDVISQTTADDRIIQKYIEDNRLTAIASGTGLYYQITTAGSGAQPSAKSQVTVNYKGYLVNGSVFDQSKIGGYTTNLNAVIKGWQEGVPYIKKGGKIKLLIPSALGYGPNAAGSIPANSVLIFDIELLDVI
jgi:FKBP-type peptidyl-prolyl cis-trans isomerase FkpA